MVVDSASIFNIKSRHPYIYLAFDLLTEDPVLEVVHLIGHLIL